MLPKWHILLGSIFTLVIWYFAPSISWLYLSLIFLSSFLIDFDHYICAVKNNNKLSLFHAFKYHDKQAEIEKKENKSGIRKKGDFHLFHTVEFHVLVGIVGIFFSPFFYIFIGMVFHSLLDLIWLLKEDRFYRREYFLFNWMRKKS